MSKAHAWIWVKTSDCPAICGEKKKLIKENGFLSRKYVILYFFKLCMMITSTSVPVSGALDLISRSCGCIKGEHANYAFGVNSSLITFKLCTVVALLMYVGSLRFQTRCFSLNWPFLSCCSGEFFFK